MSITNNSLNMDNKLKFSDRLKALLKSDSYQSNDPYVFCEPEPILSSQMDVKNSRYKPPQSSPSSSSSSRGNSLKCTKKRLKPPAQFHPSCPNSNEINYINGNIIKSPRNYELHCTNNSVNIMRRQRRDHTLLYYPRAGDEISDSESSGDELTIYQRHWFEPSDIERQNGPRSARLSQVRSQLRRRLIQLHNGGQESEIIIRKRTQRLLDETLRNHLLDNLKINNKKTNLDPLLTGGPCGTEGCRQSSLPCTRHCSQHIMLNTDQLLFEHCTAKFSDNTQCSIPVFDVTHELPLCPEHARKRDNYNRKAQEIKPKKTRKKSGSSSIGSGTSGCLIKQKVNNKTVKSKKRKRNNNNNGNNNKPIDDKLADIICDQQQQELTSNLIQNDLLNNKTLNNINVMPSIGNNVVVPGANLGLGLGTLGLGNSLKVELGDHEVFAALDTTEHDFGNVLNNLPADAFNDLFIESRNGEFEPSREEAEELERALEAVDKDVRNLERMGQSHGLLEPALLAQLMSDIAS